MKISACIFAFLYVLVFIFSPGCSSSEKTAKEEKKEEVKETTGVKKVKNLDALERDYISKNKIRMIDRIQFDYGKNKTLKNREKLSTLKYDKNGYLTETVIYDKKGNVDYTYKYEYKGGRRVKTLRYNSNGNLDKTFTYEYNESGNKFRSERLSPNGRPEEYYEYEYDDEGNLLLDEWFDMSGNRIFYIEHEYEDGRKYASYSYDAGGDLIRKYVYRYDGDGNVVEETRFGPGDEELGIIQYIYHFSETDG